MGNLMDCTPKVVYLCDGKKECWRSSFCGVNKVHDDKNYPYDFCMHTSTIRNAKNGYCEHPEKFPERFVPEKFNGSRTIYMEVE